MLPSNTKRIIYISLLLIPLLGFYSCSIFIKEDKIAFYRSNPVSLFYTILQQNLQLETFEGQGYLTVESPTGSFNGNTQVFFRQPDSLLVQIKAGFGMAIGNMLVIGNQVMLYNIREGILYKSEGEDVPLNNLIGMNLRQGNLIEATLGLPKPPRPYIANPHENDTLRYEFENANIRYFYDYDQKEFIYTADPGKEAFVQYYLIRPNDNDTTIASFNQFRHHKKINIPQHIQIKRPKMKERLSLFYSRMKINAKIPDNCFQLEVADDVEIINLQQKSDG